MKRNFFKKVSIKWRIIAIFAIFTAVTLGCLWIFQISMLDTFYREIKIRELKSCAQALVSAVDEDLSEVVSDLSQSREINILITDENGVTVASGQTSPNSPIHYGNPFSYASLYRDTVKNGGTLFQTYTGKKIDFAKPAFPDDGGTENMVYARAVESAAGEKLLILIQARLSPVDATVETLRVQLFCITGLMLVLSAVLTFVLSSRISRPIIKINSTAGKLGDGDYGVTFEESGYREISELGKTLNHTAQELGKTEALRRELIANVSHDLRTPLTMIAGYSEVMRDLPGENSPENLQIIIDETKHLSDLVSDMLDLSKLQSGTQSLSPAVFCLTSDLRDILSRYKKLADYNFILLAEEDAFVCADELKISQVIYNLINNAVSYTGKDKTITLKQTLTEKDVRIDVMDTGPGIAEDKLKDIWQRYYKDDRTARRPGSGSGLGLSIVKAILDLHHASCGVESTPGRVSNFWFSLPRSVDIPEESE